MRNCCRRPCVDKGDLPERGEPSWANRGDPCPQHFVARFNLGRGLAEKGRPRDGTLAVTEALAAGRPD